MFFLRPTKERCIGMRRIALLLASTALAVLLAGGAALAAVEGTTITVNSKGDGTKSGNCTLREAIEAADTNTRVDRCKAGSSSERDAVHFSLGEKATITLGSQLPTITDPSRLTINGQKPKITVSGNDAVRVFEVGQDAQLSIANLKVVRGRAEFGGGIFNFGTVTVRDSAFSGNSATMSGGGIDNRGTLKVTTSTFSHNSTNNPNGNNFGGGIVNDGVSTVSKSTFSSNSSLQGGGISNFGELTVTNSTLSGNIAGAGGGIHQTSRATSLTVTNSTFSGNSADRGGAIFNQNGLPPFPNSPVTISSTIVANSTSGDSCSGTITDSGYNIDDGTTCGFSEANDSLPSTEPKLADSLNNNGGPTKTIALRKGSPALNEIPKASNGCGTEVKTDQRGAARPQGKKCDIGAFEKEVKRRR